MFSAAFRLAADVPTGFKTFSKTPVVRQEALPGGALQRISFETTPRITIHLLAFVTGEFERNALVQGGVEIGVATIAGKQGAAAGPLDATTRLLRDCDDVDVGGGVRYPLPQLAQTAMPGGFNGAMAISSAIIVNGTAVLHDSARRSDSAWQQVFATMAREMARERWRARWRTRGSATLVTKAWWDSLGLNEGIASWTGNKATDHLNPAGNVWLDANGRANR